MILLSLPHHALIQLACNALPYEKLNYQGQLNFLEQWLTAFNYSDDFSSENPPDKKCIPGSEIGIVLDKTLMVASAILFASTGLASDPGLIKFGFNNAPSNRTPWLSICITTLVSIFVHAFSHISIEWSPSCNTSGSIIGTNPLCWHIIANLAKLKALSWIAISDG